MKTLKLLPLFLFVLLISSVMFFYISGEDHLVYAQAPTPIYYLQDLNAVRDGLSGDYILMNDLDFNINSSYDQTDADWELKKTFWTTGTGWEPIGTISNRFSGIFDGQDFSISGLFIDNPVVADVGLFGALSLDSQVHDLNLLDIDISIGLSSVDEVGGLAGYLNGGKLENIYVSGSIIDEEGNSWMTGGVVGYATLIDMSNCSSTVNIVGVDSLGGLIGSNFRGTVSTSQWEGVIEGTSYLGGLLGQNEGGVVSDSHTSGSVLGDVNLSSAYIGGLVGNNRHYWTWDETGEIKDSSSLALVTGKSEVGGLVGLLEGSLTFIENSYATGDVLGSPDSFNLGGLVGWVTQGAAVRKSFASGNVVGDDYVGGLIGRANGIITDSYALGDVAEVAGGYEDGYYIGGLIGEHYGDAETHNSYSVGTVTAFDNSDVGGLIGSNSGLVVANSFWDMDSSLMTISDGGMGKTTEQMKLIVTYNDVSTEGLDEEWNILGIEVFDPENPSIWYIDSGLDYPRLFFEYTGWEGDGEEEGDVEPPNDEEEDLLEEDSTDESETDDTEGDQIEGTLEEQLPKTGMDILPFLLSIVSIFTGYLFINPRKKTL